MTRCYAASWGKIYGVASDAAFNAKVSILCSLILLNVYAFNIGSRIAA